MPSYAWLEGLAWNPKIAGDRMLVMQKLGVPYTNEQIDKGPTDARAQAEVVSADLAAQGVKVPWDREMIALIAYLQRLGRDSGIKYQAEVPTAALGTGGVPGGGR
jgi:cytochrome c oxidase cbb3-type subunit I/II